MPQRRKGAKNHKGKFLQINNMYTNYKSHLDSLLNEIKEAGLYKNERIIVSPQGAEIELNTGQKVLNFCANNYLGLSNNPSLIQAAKASLDNHAVSYTHL